MPSKLGTCGAIKCRTANDTPTILHTWCTQGVLLDPCDTAVKDAMTWWDVKVAQGKK